VKFKILPKVNRFTGPDGVRHYPGDIVDLPSRYQSKNWLEAVDKPKTVEAPPPKIELIAELPIAKVEEVAKVEDVPIPLGNSKRSRRAR
jgi:hypothetical protein